MKATLLCLLFNLMSVHICHTCLNFTIYNVTFSATNFEYMLHWNKDDLPQNVSFNVQYKRYGQPEWLLIHDCQNITRVYCNLTNVITDDEEYFMENQYFGRVKALSSNCTSDWFISKRLNPRDDTYLVLPKLNYVQHVNSITIVIPTPSVPISGKDKQPVTVEDLYRDDHVNYHLNFFDPEKQHTWQEAQAGRKFEVSGLSPDMEYNGSIYMSIGNKRKSDLQYFVVRTLPDHSLVTLIASLIAVFVATLVAGLLLFSCKYIKQQVQTPNSLVFKKSTGLPLMHVPKEKVINSCSVGFCPTIFTQNYEQNYKETSRKTWKEISGNSQLKMYASKSHGAMTQGQDSVDTQESYCSQNNTSSLVSSVQYGEVLHRTSSNKSYLQNTTPSSCSKASYDFEGHLQINTHQPFGDIDGDMSNAFVDDSFKFDLFSSLLGEGTNILNSIPPMGLISSVTVRNDEDFTAQMEQTEEHPPVLLTDLDFDGFTSNHMEEDNMQHILLGHGSRSYTLQCPVINSTTNILDATNGYKKQCIL
ncbi:interleukin-22 receptor subunit alpha-1 [Leptodactylus fuscus]|uniref:interleukin-22 receptor subunit alpha-1 n=1 Tax=Leptodactylus fuscus TaxID=238119 RepID=UPI003F4E5152